MAEGSRLTSAEVADRVAHLRGWDVEDDQLTRTFKFPDFMSAIEFVDRLAPVAESEGHHPDLEVGWGRVAVHLTSHDAGGLTDKDFHLASLIDQL